MFAARFEVLELYTGEWQGPDFTVHWLLSSLLRAVKDPNLVQRLRDMTVNDLARLGPLSTEWRALLRSMDESSISELSCGNTLIGRRKSVL
jgi:hypothetical protein